MTVKNDANRGSRKTCNPVPRLYLLGTIRVKGGANMDDIIWKDIVGYEGIYKISNTGLVKKNNGKIMMPYETRKGYLRLGLSKDGKRKQFMVHRLVAIAFLYNENPSIKNEVNHIDLNKKNNNVENLEWIDTKGNVNHAINNIEGRKDYLQKTMSDIGKNNYHYGVEASKKPVLQIDAITNEIIDKFESAREASLETGANYKNISKVCNGQARTHKGYIWRFA